MGTVVAAAQEFANASSAKCGFTSILQPTAETSYNHHFSTGTVY